MAKHTKRWAWPLGSVGALAMGGVVAFSGNPTSAQIAPDGTLGPERSIVKPNVTIKGLPADRIDGGATRGANLFQSFREFNVGDGQRVYFANPAGIENVLSRVTGTNLSDIQGTLGVDGKANLFLLNPNGIIFGPNAQLDVTGSFVASTANGLMFGNSFEFGAINPQAPPLLTINAPTGLQYGSNPRSLINQSIANGVGLQVQPRRTVALVGGDVGIEGSRLTAVDGRIELGSVGSNSLVNLTPTNTGYALDYKGVKDFQDIQLSKAAFVDTSGEGGGSIQVQGKNVTLSDASFMFADTLGNQSGSGVFIKASQLTLEGGSLVTADVLDSGQGGNVTIETRQLLISGGAQVSASTFGAGDGGSLSVNASESVQVIGRSIDGQFPSGLFARTEGTGAAGDLTITTGQLLVSSGAEVSASTLGKGDGGDLIVNGSNSVQLIGTSADGQFDSGLFTTVISGATGDGGNLTVETGQLIVRDGAAVSTATFSTGRAGDLGVRASESVQLIGESADGLAASRLSTSVQSRATGDGGNLTVETGQLIVRDGAAVSASTFGAGSAGNLVVEARDSVKLIGTSEDGQFPSGLFTDVAKPKVTGDGGNLTLETERLIVQNGAQVVTGTIGTGQAGDLAVSASESVELIGTTDDGWGPSGLFTNAQQGTGDGGSLTVETGRLIVRDGALVFAGTFDAGSAGTLTVRAFDSVEVIGGRSANSRRRNSFLGTSVDPGATGDGGNLTLETGQLIVRDGAEVTVGSLGLGKAGNLQVQARSIGLDNQGAITATTRSGNGGGITLQAQDLLLMRRDSRISTRAGTEETPGTGGSITIDTDNLVALENSDIDANAFGGLGGQVFINAQGIFGTEARERQTPESDITATSNLGPQFSGTVQINTPDIDPSQGLANLPIEPVNTEIAQDCQAGGGKGTSRFVSSGSGGLPTNPYEPLDSGDILAEVQPPTQWGKNPSAAASASTLPKTTPDRIVEAQGWSVNETGEVVLVAEVPPASSQRVCRLR